MRFPAIRNKNDRFPVLNGRTRYLLNLVQDNRKGIEAAAQQWRDGAQTDSQFIKVLEVKTPNCIDLCLPSRNTTAILFTYAVSLAFSPHPVFAVLRRRRARRAPGRGAGAFTAMQPLFCFIYAAAGQSSARHQHFPSARSTLRGGVSRGHGAPGCVTTAACSCNKLTCSLLQAASRPTC